MAAVTSGTDASSCIDSPSAPSRSNWQMSAPSRRSEPSTITSPSSAAPVTSATRWAMSARPVRAPTRRRSWSYSWAFSIAPETSEAMWTSSFRIPSPNSWGAFVCRTITPIVSPARDGIGTATIDWKRCSWSSGTYFIRGSSIARSRMNSGVRWRATQPASPSLIESWTLPTASRNTGEAARIVSWEPSSR